MELTLELKQTQKLSPQMIQSMNILQMGTVELQEYVEKTLMENPVLELESEKKRDDRPQLVNKVEWLMANDRQNRWYHREDARDLIDLVADTAEESLYDHLRGQISMEKLPGRLGLAVDCVLTGLNDNGWLEETTEELAERCGQTVDTILRAEKLVRTLEPAGVGARTLSECLAIQLERMGETGLALTIVRDWLEDVAKDRYSRISKETGASRQEIQEACRQIRTLDPRPGAPYAPREAPGYIVPDLLVTELEGELVVTAGDDFLPELKVSAYYQKLMQDTEEKEVRDYLADKVRQAGWVVRSIEQRRSTLLTCARIIVARQDRFFRHGAGHLQPMTLADVAEEAGIHESTVSRAVKDKYIQCVQGVYPMSHFFGRALPSGGGDGVSSEKVKTAIRALIDGENKQKPLSDQKICDLLAEQELILSRRTVAKYRDEMGIPSTSGRKEF